MQCHCSAVYVLSSLMQSAGGSVAGEYTKQMNESLDPSSEHEISRPKLELITIKAQCPQTYLLANSIKESINQ